MTGSKPSLGGSYTVPKSGGKPKRTAFTIQPDEEGHEGTRPAQESAPAEEPKTTKGK